LIGCLSEQFAGRRTVEYKADYVAGYPADQFAGFFTEQIAGFFTGLFTDKLADRDKSDHIPVSFPAYFITCRPVCRLLYRQIFGRFINKCVIFLRCFIS